MCVSVLSFSNHSLHVILFCAGFRCAPQWLDNRVLYRGSPQYFQCPADPMCSSDNIIDCVSYSAPSCPSLACRRVLHWESRELGLLKRGTGQLTSEYPPSSKIPLLSKAEALKKSRSFRFILGSPREQLRGPSRPGGDATAPPPPAAQFGPRMKPLLPVHRDSPVPSSGSARRDSLGVTAAVPLRGRLSAQSQR